MLRQILYYDFALAGQAIDRSGHFNHGHHTSTNATSGPGDFRGIAFLSEQSRVTVPHQRSFNIMTAVRVDIRFELEALERRVNLVEAERSFALFVRGDGVITFVYYAPAEQGEPEGTLLGASGLTLTPAPTGSTDPFSVESLTANPPPPMPNYEWHGLNTSAEFSPDGAERTVGVDRFHTVSVLHDGLATMSITLDGVLAAYRSDIRYPVVPIQAPGAITIGAWPHDGRYTLNGRLDFVRIWRHDPANNFRQFNCRPMSQEARNAWRALKRRVLDGLQDPAERAHLAKLFVCLDELEGEFYRRIAKAGPAAIDQLETFARRYVDLWCGGRVSGQDMKVLMQEFFAWLAVVDPDFLEKSFGQMLFCLKGIGQLDFCDTTMKVATCDPDWGTLVDVIAEAIPNPICPDARPGCMHRKSHTEETRYDPDT